MRTEDVLDQIGEALDDWEVGPDAMRCGAPVGANSDRSEAAGQQAEVRVLLGVDVRPYLESMRRTVEILASMDFAALEKALAALGAPEPSRHHPRPLPIDGRAYHRRRRTRRTR